MSGTGGVEMLKGEFGTTWPREAGLSTVRTDGVNYSCVDKQRDWAPLHNLT